MGCNSSKEVANLYLDLREQFPDRFYLLHYERLVDDPFAVSNDVLSFCNLPFAEEVVDFVSSSVTSHNDSYYSVFKDPSVATKWYDEIPNYIYEEIKADLTGTRLEQFLYTPNREEGQ